METEMEPELESEWVTAWVQEPGPDRDPWMELEMPMAIGVADSKDHLKKHRVVLIQGTARFYFKVWR